MLFRRKKDVIVVDDGYYRNLKEEVDNLKEEVKDLKKKLNKASDFIGEQIHINQRFNEANKRMKSDVDSLKKRAD